MQNKTKHFVQKTSGVYWISRKTLWIICGTALAVFLILMTIAAFFDFQIDYLLAKDSLPTPATDHLGVGAVYTQNVFAIIIEVIGTGPCILATIFALVIFHQNAYKITSIGWKRTVQIATVVVAVLWVVYACFFQFFPLLVVSIVGVREYKSFAPLASTGWVNNATTTWVYLILGAVMGGLIVFPTYLIVRRMDKQVTSELLRWSFIVTSAGVIAILLVEIAIKPTFQRERFRFIYAYGNITGINDVPTWSVIWTGDKWVARGDSLYGLSLGTGGLDPYGGFHPWYSLPITPYGYGSAGNLPFISEDASKSFPSGHETMASIGFYSLIVLPFTVKKCNTKLWRIGTLTTAICGCVLVALGRMMAGAHYLSDVTVGNFLAMVLLFIFYVMYCFHTPHLNDWTGLTLHGKFFQNRKRV